MQHSISTFKSVAVVPPPPPMPTPTPQHPTQHPTLPTLAAVPLSTLYALLEPITLPASHPDATFMNWGRSFACVPSAVFVPVTEAQCELVLELARREGRRVRAVGAGHSPSDVACTNEYMIRMTRLNAVLEVNREKQYVVAQAGITLDDLHVELAKHELAMSSVGSISEQTLAGVVTTPTHGSGLSFGIIPTSVLALTLLLSDGTRLVCSRTENRDVFEATLCGLGTTGLILNVQLAVEGAFRLRETRRLRRFEDVMGTLEEMVEAEEHVRIWWFPTRDMMKVSCANRTDEPPKPAGSWFWDTLIAHHLIQFLLFIARFIPDFNITVSNFACWLVKDDAVVLDDSYKVFNVDCRYPQYTTEWAIPYTQTRACLTALRSFLLTEIASPDGLRPHFPVEIRFTSADSIPLSPAYGRATCWIGLVQYKPYGYNVPYKRLFEAFESIVRSFEGRPHWAKEHPVGGNEVGRVYERWGEWRDVVSRVDKNGMWKNEYVERHLVEGGQAEKTVYKVGQ